MSVHLLGPTLDSVTMRALRRYPDRTAFVCDGRRLSYRETEQYISRYQGVLAASSLSRGDRVAILSSNRFESWCCGVAAQSLGMVTTWLHPLGSLDDHVQQIVDSGAALLIVDASRYAERGERIAQDNRVSSQILSVGPTSYAREIDDLAAAMQDHRFASHANPDDWIAINYTGGTTGRAKGAVRTHAAFVASNTAVLEAFPLPHPTRYLATAPISHVAGSMVLPVLMGGGTVYMMAGFEAVEVLQTVERERINCLLLVPTMIYALLDSPELARVDISSLELLLYGASPMSPGRLEEGLRVFGQIFCQFYGQTEGFPLAVLPPADHDAARPELFAACGFPTASCDVKLMADDDREAEPGEPGEIWIRAPFLLSEYWNAPEQTDEAIVDGWLKTSDIARFDDEGRLFIVDRKKDMIISGGFNVYPREVEDALNVHPAVALSAVIGIPDERWGERVHALVIKRSDVNVSEAELIGHVRSLKSAPLAPKAVEFVVELPLTALGKIDKKALRDRFWAGRERQVS